MLLEMPSVYSAQIFYSGSDFLFELFSTLWDVFSTNLNDRERKKNHPKTINQCKSRAEIA